MYRVAIVDDQAEDAEALAQALERCRPATAGPGPVWEISRFPTASALAARLDTGYEPDLAFVDIVLDPAAPASGTPDAPQPAGIDAVAQLFAPGAQTQVIYVSGYDSFHTQVYRTPHAAYLAKPFTASDVSCAVDLALAARQRAVETPLTLRVRGAERVIRPAEILYLESNLHLVRIHTATETIEAYIKLGDLLRQLPAHFVRTHQSFAVNLDAVSALDATSITLATGDAVPVSRRMRAAVRDALFAHIREARR
ncbi:MAG TPA: response regulator transcription factor [Candidatus Coprousia avicola]|nr:response regulator transcription factor [Candidatus Coprousia avicola]